MNQSIRRALLVGASLLLGSTVSVSTFAATPWQAHHPRRVQVNSRLANQNRRIHREVRQGEMSHAQAAALHQQDRQIRGEERAMASQQGGHLTRAQQRALNQQENGVSRQIGH